MTQPQPMKRFEIALDDGQRAGLNALAGVSGLSPTALTRFAIVRLLNDRGLILGDGPVSEQRDFEAFLAEMRANPAFAPQADGLAEAFETLDFEGGGNKHAAALVTCLGIIAKAVGPLDRRVALMLLLVNFRGEVPRGLLKGFR